MHKVAYHGAVEQNELSLDLLLFRYLAEDQSGSEHSLGKNDNAEFQATDSRLCRPGDEKAQGAAAGRPRSKENQESDGNRGCVLFCPAVATVPAISWSRA